MNLRKKLNQIKSRRKNRVKARVSGAADRPRLAVYRSNRAISAQLIDDDKGFTLVFASSRELGKEAAKKNKSEQAAMVGELLGGRAKGANISEMVFDRRSYAYHGRVRALAEAVRKSGIKM